MGHATERRVRLRQMDLEGDESTPQQPARSCVRCGYPRKGVIDRPCPECGFVLAHLSPGQSAQMAFGLMLVGAGLSGLFVLAAWAEHFSGPLHFALGIGALALTGAASVSGSQGLQIPTRERRRALTFVCFGAALVVAAHELPRNEFRTGLFPEWSWTPLYLNMAGMTLMFIGICMAARWGRSVAEVLDSRAGVTLAGVIVLSVALLAALWVSRKVMQRLDPWIWPYTAPVSSAERTPREFIAVYLLIERLTHLCSVFVFTAGACWSWWAALSLRARAFALQSPPPPRSRELR